MKLYGNQECHDKMYGSGENLYYMRNLSKLEPIACELSEDGIKKHDLLKQNSTNSQGVLSMGMR